MVIFKVFSLFQNFIFQLAAPQIYLYPYLDENALTVWLSSAEHTIQVSTACPTANMQTANKNISNIINLVLTLPQAKYQIKKRFLLCMSGGGIGSCGLMLGVVRTIPNCIFVSQSDVNFVQGRNGAATADTMKQNKLSDNIDGKE